MADITPRKPNHIVTLSEHWNYNPNSHCKRYAKKTSFELQKNLMHAGVHISSSTARRRLLEAGRKAKKPLKKQLLTQKMKTKIRMGNKYKCWTVEDW